MPGDVYILSSRRRYLRGELIYFHRLFKQTPQAPSNSATYPPLVSHPSSASPVQPHQHPSKPSKYCPQPPSPSPHHSHPSSTSPPPNPETYSHHPGPLASSVSHQNHSPTQHVHTQSSSRYTRYDPLHARALSSLGRILACQRDQRCW